MPRPAVFARAQFDLPSPPRPNQARGPAQIGGDAYAEDEAATTIWNPQQRFAEMQSPFDMFMPPPPPSIPAPRSMPSYPAVSIDAAPPSSRTMSNGFNDPTMTVRKKSDESPLASIFTTHKWTTIGASALAASLATVIAVIALGAGAFDRNGSHHAKTATTEPQVSSIAAAAQLPTYDFTPPQAVHAQVAAPRAITTAVVAPIVPAPIAVAPAPVVTASPLATNDAIAKDPSAIPTWRAQAPVPASAPTAQKTAPIAIPRVLTDVAPADSKPTRTAHKDDETSAAQDALNRAKQETEGSLN